MKPRIKAVVLSAISFGFITGEMASLAISALLGTGSWFMVGSVAIFAALVYGLSLEPSLRNLEVQERE